MRGSVPGAKKRSVHVRSHISNRPNFARTVFFRFVASMNSNKAFWCIPCATVIHMRCQELPKAWKMRILKVNQLV